jgi:hypothetical protein
MKLTMIGAPAPWAGGSNSGDILNAPPVEANEMLQVGRLPVPKTRGDPRRLEPGLLKGPGTASSSGQRRRAGTCTYDG